MSPYRVLVSNDDTYAVLSAMLSKKDDELRIYIVEKADLKIFKDDGALDYDAIAYRMTTKSNSVIVGNYFAEKDDTGSKYSVFKKGSRFTYDLGSEFTTLSACLKAAMEHFCEIHNLHIEHVFG